MECKEITQKKANPQWKAEWTSRKSRKKPILNGKLKGNHAKKQSSMEFKANMDVNEAD